jgi:uncharacterized protein (TIRG00374 family)
LNGKSLEPSQILNRLRPYIAPAVLLSLFVSGGFLLAYLLRDMEWALIRRTGPSSLALILVLSVVRILLYALLVYMLVRNSGYNITMWQSYLMLTASLSANYVTPVKIGVPLRVYLYNHFIGIPTAVGTALVTVEALVGMLVPALITIVGIVFLFPSVSPVAPIALIIFLLAGLLLISRAPVNRLKPYLQQLPCQRLTMRLVRFGEDIQSGLRHISHMAVLGAVILDLLMIGLHVWRLWLVLNVFDSAPSLLALLAVLNISLTVGNLSMIPMGIGVRDVSFTLLLMQLGVPNEIALSAAVIQRLFSPGWPLLLGLISTNILGIEVLRVSSKHSLTGDDL